MLSIAIPIYNQDINPLVKELSEQCEVENIDYEILCFDDASKQQYRDINQNIQSNPNVIYKELKQNVGRSKIRNLLAKEAHYDSILFLDSDSTIISSSFIQIYLQHIDYDLVSGGRVYPSEKPKDLSKILHWTYGQKRESRSAVERNKYPYIYFHSNNFLVKKHVFNKLRFDETISSYGYEDLVFADDFKKLDISITHIDNAIQHMSLENTQDFKKKTMLSIEGLAKLYKQGKAPSTKLIKWFTILSKCKCTFIVTSMYNVFSKKIHANLDSSNPSMIFFSFWKLSEFVNALN